MRRYVLTAAVGGMLVGAVSVGAVYAYSGLYGIHVLLSIDAERSALTRATGAQYDPPRFAAGDGLEPRWRTGGLPGDCARRVFAPGLRAVEDGQPRLLTFGFGRYGTWALPIVLPVVRR